MIKGLDLQFLISKNSAFSRFGINEGEFLENKSPILKEKRGIIYLIVNLVNGKVYVGLSRDSFHERYRYNWIKWTDNEHLKRAVDKYGKDNFQTVILEENRGINILNILETYYILSFNSNNSEFGYNKTTGGDNNYILSRETIAKMSYSRDEFIQLAMSKHGYKYNYDSVEYINSRIKIKILCLCCNQYFMQTPNAHLSGKGCLTCGIRSMANNNLISFDQFLDKISLEFKSEYEFFRNTYTRFHDGIVTLKHLKCGTVFDKNPNQLLRSKIPCPTCYKQYCIDKGKQLRLSVNNKNISQWKLAKGFENYKKKVAETHFNKIDCLEYTSKSYKHGRNILYVKHRCNNCNKDFWRTQLEMKKPCPHCYNKQEVSIA